MSTSTLKKKSKFQPIIGHVGPEVHSSTHFSNLGSRGGVGGLHHAPATLPQRRPVPII